MIPTGSPTTLSVCVSPDAFAHIPALTFLCLTSSGIGQRGKTNSAPWHTLSLSASPTGAGGTEPVWLVQRSNFPHMHFNGKRLLQCRSPDTDSSAVQLDSEYCPIHISNSSAK